MIIRGQGLEFCSEGGTCLRWHRSFDTTRLPTISISLRPSTAPLSSSPSTSLVGPQPLDERARSWSPDGGQAYSPSVECRRDTVLVGARRPRNRGGLDRPACSRRIGSGRGGAGDLRLGRAGLVPEDHQRPDAAADAVGQRARRRQRMAKGLGVRLLGSTCHHDRPPLARRGPRRSGVVDPPPGLRRARGWSTPTRSGSTSRPSGSRWRPRSSLRAPLVTQLQRSFERIRELGDITFDQGTAEFGRAARALRSPVPRSPRPPVCPIGRRSGWPRAQPLVSAWKGTTAHPSGVQSTAAWVAAVGRSGAPAQATLRRAVVDRTSARQRTDLVGAVDRAEVSLSSVPGPRGQPQASDLLRLGLLVDAEALLAAEASGLSRRRACSRALRRGHHARLGRGGSPFDGSRRRRFRRCRRRGWS